MAKESDALERAWKFRESWFEPNGAARIFHGPAEGIGTDLERIAIDRFDDWYWVTQWEGSATEGKGSSSERASAESLVRVQDFLVAKGARGGVHLPRPERGTAEESRVWFGEVPQEGISVREGELRFSVRLLGVRHPGLFLDHRPLREWLRENLSGHSVLNCFAYTGSLSVAAGVGGAQGVTTLDLSKPSIRWAEENWKLNELAADRARFIAGDVFERLPRFVRQGERFDCVILDPPSFSRGTKGSFSTARDLPALHRLAFDCLTDGGVLVTSINSANVRRAKYEAEVRQAASDARVEVEILSSIGLSEAFAGPRISQGISPGISKEDYLKGWILRVRRRSPRNPRG